MAKLGEGDARWIVADRADGTNVNGWHWVEKDAMEWSKARLAAMFTGLEVASSGEQKLTITGLDSLTGEAVINNRKQKIIPTYELEIKLNWEGTAADASAKGKVHLPYVSEENHDEEPELRFVCETDNAAAKALKAAFLQGPGKQAVLKLIGQFVSELRAGGPALKSSAAPGSTPASSSAPQSAEPAKASTSSAAAAARPAAAAAPAAATTTSSKPASTSSSKARSSLKLQEQFYCRPSDLYECFTQENRIKAYTQSQAAVDASVGGSFTWFGGSVKGTFTELEPGKKIAMDWQFSSWAEGCTSKVVMVFEEPEPGHTILALEQTRIPEADAFGNEDVLDVTTKGWKGQVFTRIRQVFGYGLGL